MRIIKTAFLLSVIIVNFAFAETKVLPTTAQPRIGLVLAGGGALGFAHVGVLKVLEENRIPVHLVTGTSMGAIVGAAYASGRTVEEMEKILSGTDWDALFDESSNRRHVPYRFKSGKNREIFGNVKLGFNEEGIILPSGVIQGQYVLPVLQKLYDTVPSPVEFDKLPLPFRGVAADIETGKPYIPDRGDLATLVRASMSVPAFFSPVSIDGKLLVDGGIANNLPIDEAKKMGADVIIAIELNVDFKKRDDLESPLAITGQIVSLLLAQNSAIQKQLLTKDDILIEPVLSGYGSTDFAKSVELFAIGEKAARLALPQLKKFSVSESEYRKYSTFRERPEVGVEMIGFIDVKTDTGISKESILRDLRIKVGDKLDRTVVEEDLRGLFDTGQFREVTYTYTDKDGKKGILIEADKKEWFDRFARVGAAIEDDLDGSSFYRLGGNYRVSNLNDSGAYGDINAEIGRTPYISTELYHPLSGNSPYFFAPLARIGRNQIGVTQDGDVIAQYLRTSGQVDLRLGRQLGKSGEFSLGATRGYGNLDRDIGADTLPEFGYDIGEAAARLVVDDLDQPDFPTEGSLTQVVYRSSMEDMGASDDFSDITGTVGLPLTFGKNTLFLKSNFGHTFGDRPVERSYSLGGFLNISGYEQQSVLASDFVVGQALFFRRFSELKTPIFGFGFFAGGSVEVAHIQTDIETINDSPIITAGSVFVGADTPLLPMYLGFGLNDQDQQSIYIAVGRINNQTVQ